MLRKLYALRYSLNGFTLKSEFLANLIKAGKFIHTYKKSKNIISDSP
jgi:hypothetical protein